ncbi:MAG: DUF547 domain-containing protein, partial [Cyclobacteriaceae bacterium]|nr:DUF547 domain-containing protein [Cyclobacteriaceae bacterium]
MNKILIIAFLILSFLKLSAGGNDLFFKNADDFFHHHVKYGNVNYSALKTNSTQLNSLVDQIRTATLPEDKNERKALYINAYNILVISATVSNYPVQSVMDIPGFFNEK